MQVQTSEAISITNESLNDGALAPGRAHPGSLDACFEHTDLRWRLTQIPDSAMCRGAYFNMLDARAGILGPAVQREYRAFFPVFKFNVFRMYSVRDYLTRLVVLAQIRYGAKDIYRGIEDLQRQAFSTWANTLMGKATLALVDRDVVSILRAIESAFASQMIVNYSTFRIDRVDSEQIIATLDNEYNYIEHAMVGALRGVLEACDVVGTVTAELASPFHGEVRIRLAPTR